MFLDPEYVSHRLEAMKMAQATLQQIMTLSAGGLALFFSFIGKAQFMVGIELLGAGVVVAWICHYILFLSIADLSAAVKRVAALDSLPEEVEAEIKTNPNTAAILNRAQAKLALEKTQLSTAFDAFDKSFFPRQVRALAAVNVSLVMLVFGFVELGLGYLMSRYAT